MYGDDEGVAAFTPRFANESGRFDNVTTPTMAQVLTWMTQISAMLDVSLATAGLPAPATSSTVIAMLDGFVNANTSGLVRAVNGQGRYAEKPSSVDEMLLSIQSAADLWVKSHAAGIGSLSGLSSEEAAGSGAGSRLPTRQIEYTRYADSTSEYAP
jgi:hypothetical protein